MNRIKITFDVCYEYNGDEQIEEREIATRVCGMIHPDLTSVINGIKIKDALAYYESTLPVSYYFDMTNI